MYLWDTFGDTKIDISVKIYLLIYKQLKFALDEAEKSETDLSSLYRFFLILSDKLNYSTW